MYLRKLINKKLDELIFLFYTVIVIRFTNLKFVDKTTELFNRHNIVIISPLW